MLRKLLAVIKQRSYFKNISKRIPMCLHIPCGLVVRIWRFHRHGPGSIPGMGIFISTFKILFKDVSYRTR